MAAEALWNIRGSAATLIDVTVPSQNGRVRRNGIRIHRSGRLGADEATTKDGIPDHRRQNPPRPGRRFEQPGTEEGDRRGRIPEAVRPQRPHRHREQQPGKTWQHTVGGRGRSAAAHPIRVRESLSRVLRAPQAPRAANESFWCTRSTSSGRTQPDRRARRLRRRSTRRAFQADRERDRRLIAAGFRAIRLTPLDLANGRSLARALRGLLKSRMTVERSRPGERWFER